MLFNDTIYTCPLVPSRILRKEDDTLAEFGLGEHALNMNNMTIQLLLENLQLCQGDDPVRYQEIPINRVYATQMERYSEKTSKAIVAGESCFPVLVGTFQDKDGSESYFIFDGHHRAAYFTENHKKNIPAIVLNLQQKPTGLCFPINKYVALPIIQGGGSDSPYMACMGYSEV